MGIKEWWKGNAMSLALKMEKGENKPRTVAGKGKETRKGKDMYSSPEYVQKGYSLAENLILALKIHF